MKNQDETDVDCGGSKCSKCGNGRTCTAVSDCISDFCDSARVCNGEYTICADINYYIRCDCEFYFGKKTSEGKMYIGLTR